MGFDWRAAADLPIVSGGGHIPTRRRFLRLRAPLWIAGHGIHDNPRFYKHTWKIWTWDDVIPDEDLQMWRARLGHYPWLHMVPDLAFSTAIARMRDLCAQGQRFFVADQRWKRDDPDLWDVDAIRSKGSSLAAHYDPDEDTPFHGHK
jgi:hypothetical protein